MLWYKLTSIPYQPLFPCKHILPIMCTYWNSIKYVGDQITQMLWLRKFHPPRLTPQVCATMKLVFYLPQYQIHRLYQLESLGDLSSIRSLRHYRKRVGQHTTLFDSMKDTNGIIKSMIVNDDPISTITQSSITSTPRISRRLQHPPAIREKGVTDITNWHAPTTGFVPQRNMAKFYNEAFISSSCVIDDTKRIVPLTRSP